MRLSEIAYGRPLSRASSGQTLPPLTYESSNVVILNSGGTLSHIVVAENAKGNNISVDDLRLVNGLTPDMDTRLQVGQTILVPQIINGNLVVDYGSVRLSMNRSDGTYQYLINNSTNNSTVLYSRTIDPQSGQFVDRYVETDNASGLEINASVRVGGQLIETIKRNIGGHSVEVEFAENSDGDLVANRVVNIDGRTPADQTSWAADMAKREYSADEFAEGATPSEGATLEGYFSAFNPNVPNGGQTLFNAINQYGGTLIDALSIIKAIQTGNPLPIVASGLRLAADFAPPTSTALSGASNLASGVLSVMSLEQALKRGDTLAAVTSGAQALNFGAQAYLSLIDKNSATASELVGFLSGSKIKDPAGNIIGQTPGALAYLSLVNDISNGDAVGTAIDALQIASNAGWITAIPGINAIAIAYAVFNMIESLFDDEDPPPEPWGTASATWSGYTAVVSSNGGEGGQQTAYDTYNGVLSYLNQLAAYEQSVNPGSAIGVVANRLPSLSYRNYSGFQLTDIDPLTGVQNYPEVKYDLTGRPYNAPPGSDQASQSLSERFIRVALARDAVAPMWEVQTAAMQTMAGDPKAGLTEEERAGRNGMLANPVTGPEQLWRPVALDLNGDGVQTTGAVKAAAFDVDDSGYLKNTAWLSNSDGFLFLDRNLNGQIDSAKELFSNGTVALGARGLKGMAWVDANYDGKLTAVDPVWNELKVWQDANGDGLQEAGETHTLASLGITALDYAMGRFERNGQLQELSSPDLVADTEGSRTYVIPEGIVVETSNGHTSLLVTRIDDKTVIEANRDGVTSYEDTEAIISTADLLANDMLGGFMGSNLTVTGVSNFTHGTGWLDGNGFVHYNPAANYYGPASFTYTIKAPTGQTDTATVDINLLNLNDAPTATVDQHVLPVYGYASCEWQYQQIPNSDGYAYNYVMVPTNPQHSPYSGYDYSQPNASYFPWQTLGYHNTPIAYEDIDGTNVGNVVASDIDDPNGPFSYEVIAQPQMGSATIDSAGKFTYTNWYGPNTPGNDGSSVTQQDMFTVRVTDPHGASTTTQVSVTHYGNYYPTLGSGGGGGKKPISIDLGNDGFGFTNIDDSNIFFDVNGDGFKHRIAWPSAGDGLLAYDADGNGKIDHASEIAFTGYADAAQTDLQGLAAFDSNGDGIFSAADDKWSKFGIWQDANQNGVTDPGEFRSLDDIGIASIALTSDGQFSVINGQTVHGVATATKTDGSTLNVADVTLQYSNDVQVTNADGTQQVVSQSPFSPSGEELNGTDGNDLILGKTGNNIVNAMAGDDVVMEDGGNDVIDGGGGNDTIYSGADNDLVMAGAGDDVVFGGLGDDMILGGDGHDALLAEGGNDVVFGGAGNDLVSGGWGNDVLSGDAGDDQVYGESGNDALFGGAGNDELAGMDGYDRLDGGAGNDLLDGGADADEMIGGAGDDIYVVDNAADIVTENPGEGIDTVRSSIGYTLGVNVENLTLTGTENLTGIGNDAANVLTGNSGANLLAGGAGNDTLDGGAGADTLVGGSGDDTCVVDNAADAVVEAAGEGNDTVLSSVSYALSDNVENLVLTGHSAIDGSGNALDNTVTGNSADNVLDGGSGADVMVGGRGNDTYLVDNAGDQTIEAAGEGADTVVSSLSWNLSDNVENLVLSGSGDLNGTGNTLDNMLIGNAGNNVLDGGAGVDTLAGGAGDDSYVVDNTADVVVENAGEGTDTVYSSASYTLSANVENLTLTGSAASDGIGNELDNTMLGNSADNVLDGGAGADAMAGGAGNDTYVVDNAGDQTIEVAGEGTDTVVSGLSWTLADNVENLTLTGAADLTGVGNGLDNILIANAGNNLLDGGAGVDVMAGGAGNDTYIVDNTDDVVVENAGPSTGSGQAMGIDSVYSSATYALSDNVENLTLTGTDAIDGAGNGLDNVLIGNTAANVLDGGAGVDTMAGGAGDDSYVVDHSADVVVENSGEGTDTVYSSATYTLSDNVENLVLTGSDAINGTGNVLDNILVGNGADNVLDGVAGADTMAGGAGNDSYIVDNAGDAVVEATGEGADSVYASVSYTLSDNVENLILTGDGNTDALGNGLDNLLVGNGGDNSLGGGVGNDTLLGNDGNDWLDGGEGADAMAGGTGDDAYVVDSSGDGVTELAGEGADTVYASIDYALGANLENLVLTGAANLNGAGNELDNTLLGNVGDNQIDGGTGADAMVGGGGNDTYIVDNAADAVVESAGEGVDQVFSSVSYALTDNVENLTLTGAATLDGTGNILDNAITGNSAANVLDGGLGADVLTGGAGDDTYIVDNAGDLTVELAGEGTDSVYSSVSYTLADNVENLYFTGTGNVDANGNSLANQLVGNAGDNRLYGGAGDDILYGEAGNDVLDGGTGNDLLNGGIGNDTYVWRKGDGLDGIYDASGNDVVQFGDGLTLDNLALRVTTEGGVKIAHLRTLNEGGCEMADQGFDFLVETDRCGKYVSPIEKFYLADGTALTFDDLLIKTDVTKVRPHDGTIITGRNDDIIYGSGRSDLIYAGTGNDIVYASAAKDTVYGQGGNDTLFGGSGSDTLDGGCGNDLLFGGAGRDTLYGGGGNNLLDGGVDTDVLTDGAGNSFFVGGRGNDTLTLGGGNDIVAFNNGDGKDVIELGSGNLTLSLGKEIRTRDLSLGRSGQDLILKVEGCDSVTLKGWYTAHGNTTLQMVQEGSVKTFDFNGLAAAFDGAAGQGSGKDRWTVANALPGLQLSSSDRAAIGGDLAYRYGTAGDFDGLSNDTKLAILSDASFGVAAQAISRPEDRHNDHRCDDSYWNNGNAPQAGHGNTGWDFSHAGADDRNGPDSHDKPADKVQSRIDAMLHRWFDADKASNPIRLSNYQEIISRGRNDQGVRGDNDGGCYADQWQRMHDQLDAHFAAYHGDFGMDSFRQENAGASNLGLVGLAELSRASGIKSSQGAAKEVFQTFKGLNEGFARLG